MSKLDAYEQEILDAYEAEPIPVKNASWKNSKLLRVQQE